MQRRGAKTPRAHRGDCMKLWKGERMPKMFRKGSAVFIIAMLVIPVIWFIIFYLIVNINSIVMAFKTITGIDDFGQVTFAWSLENFVSVFHNLGVEGSELQVATINSLKYSALNIFLIIPLTYFFSYFLYKKLLFHKFFRVLFYLPSIISAVTMVIIFKNLIGFGGPIYELAKALGLQLPPLLTSSRYATPTIMVYCVWVGFGVNLILYQGAMGRIPEEIIDAGRIDGVSWWRELFCIVTPMIWSTISMTLILAVTGLFTVNVPILVFGTGGAYDTWTISYYIFTRVQSQSSGALNYPAAIGVFFTIISLPIVFGFRWIMNKFDPKVEY